MLGFPGFGGGERLPSGDPVLPGDIADSFTAERTRDEIVGHERRALLEEKFAVVLEGVFTKVATAAADKIDNALNRSGYASTLGRYIDAAVDGSVGASIAQPATQTGASGASTPQPSPTSEERLTEGAVPPKEKPQPQHPYKTFKEGQQRAAHMSMSEAAKSATAPLAKAFSESGKVRWVQVDDEDPSKGYYQHDTTNDSAVMGSFTHDISTGARTLMGARALAGGLAAGEGVVGSLGAAATRVAGPIGIAVGAGQMIGSQLESQNAKASQYRAAFGEEGTGMFAARDRIGEFFAGVSGFGTIGGEQARAQYQQASAMGLRGQRRDDATDFMHDMTMRFGMSTSEGAALVEQAIQQGNTSLSAFAETITEVSRAAVEAGQSSREAIKDFTETQSFVATNLTASGTGSLEATEAISSAIRGSMPTGLRQSMGNVQGVASTLLTQDNIMRVAAASGQQDPMQAWNRARDPQTSGQQVTDTLEQSAIVIVRSAAAAMGMSEDELRTLARKHTGGAIPSVENQFAILQAMTNEAGLFSVDAVLQAIAPFAGLNPAPSQLQSLLFWALADERTGSGGGGSNAPSTMDRLGGLFGGEGSAPTYKKGSSTRAAVAKSIGLSTEGDKPSYTGGIGGLPSQGASDPAAFSEYLGYTSETGRGSAEIERLLNPDYKEDVLEASGESSMSDVKYRVLDKKGNAVSLSLEEIIDRGSHYVNQMGNADIVGKDNTAQSVRVVLEFAGPGKDWIAAQTGPSDEQRAGVPATSVNVGPGYRAGG